MLHMIIRRYKVNTFAFKKTLKIEAVQKVFPVVNRIRRPQDSRNTVGSYEARSTSLGVRGAGFPSSSVP